MVKKWFVLLLAGTIFLAACTGFTQPEATDAGSETAASEIPEASALPEDEETTVESKEDTQMILENDKYGAALTDLVFQEQKRNTVVSPVSADLAMAMLLEGAEGETKEELERFLGVKKEELSSYIEEIMKCSLDTEEGKVILSNAFWYLKELNVRNEYLEVLMKRYKAETSDLDFSDASRAAKVINDWCSEKTNGLIPSVVDENDVSGMSDVILNTVYFNNKWAKPIEDIHNGTFRGYDQDFDVEMLSCSENTYYENERAEAFEKPYLGKYSFIGILPKQEGEFDLESLDIESLLDHRSDEYDRVNVTMPKLNIESGGSITGALQQMGVVSAFTGAADLTGIANELMVSDVIHKTKLSLDENGTEAAAATAVMILAMGLPREEKTTEIILDRPFAFLIRDNETGNVLFTGKVTEF